MCGASHSIGWYHQGVYGVESSHGALVLAIGSLGHLLTKESVVDGLKV